MLKNYCEMILRRHDAIIPNVEVLFRLTINFFLWIFLWHIYLWWTNSWGLHGYYSGK